MSRIKVFARVRPSKRPSGFFTFQDEHNQLKFDVPLKEEGGLVNNSKSEYIFKFDGLLPMNVSQEKVFTMVAKPAVLSAIDGFNSTLFAYGQTGSGKTFTITGGAERYNDRGIIPRSLSYMFNEFQKRTDTQFTAYISYLELYNEQGYDLLDPSHETKSLEELPRVQIMEDEDGNTHLRNLSMHPASSEEEALNLLFLGDTNRAISETPMNDASSRSHCVFTISIEARTAGSTSIRRSKFHLVDLAGSERVHKTSSSGQTLREAKHINTSLHFLEMVIINLSGKKKNSFVPYRNCRITQVLRDSLGGNCKTAMIATINPEPEFTDESISTCRFAQRVAQVKNSAIVNEETDPYLLIKRLKAEVASLKAEIAFLKGEQEDGDELDADDKQALLALCREWVQSGFDNDTDDGTPLRLGDFSLSRIHGAFFALKRLALEDGGVGSGGGGSGGADSFSPIKSGGGGTEAVDGAEMKRLRAQLHNRDQEIAILVKMVKKEKEKNARMAGGSVPPCALTNTAQTYGAPATKPYTTAPSPIHVGGGGGARGLSSAGGQSRGGGGGGGGGASAAAARLATPGSTAGVGSTGTRVGGGVGGMLATFSVPPDVLMDRKRALEAFKRNYPKQQIVEENLGIMKGKIKEVKDLAGSVNKARQRIQYLKATIEQVRVEQAVHGIIDGGESKKEPSQQESKLLDEMAGEKKVYKQGYQTLQQLRKEMTQIDRLINKCRKQLNSDFESWYTASLERAGLTHTAVAAISGVMHSAQARASAAGAGPSASGPAAASASAAAAAAAATRTRPHQQQAWRGRSADGRPPHQHQGSSSSSAGGVGGRASSSRSGGASQLYDQAAEMRMKQMQQAQQQAQAQAQAQARQGRSGLSQSQRLPTASSYSNPRDVRGSHGPASAAAAGPGFAAAPPVRSGSAGHAHVVRHGPGAAAGAMASRQPVASAMLPPGGGFHGAGGAGRYGTGAGAGAGAGAGVGAGASAAGAYRGGSTGYGGGGVPAGAVYGGTAAQGGAYGMGAYGAAAAAGAGGGTGMGGGVGASMGYGGGRGGVGSGSVHHHQARQAARQAAPAPVQPVYPMSPGAGIRSSGATMATSGRMPPPQQRSTDEDIMAFYKAKAQLDQLRQSGGFHK